MNGKRKGSAGERELLDVLGAHGQAVRNDQRFVGGRGNPDIAWTCGGRCFHVEVKRVERLNIHAAMRQAAADAVNMIPAVIHRRNREGWLVTMNLCDLMGILEDDRND